MPSIKLQSFGGIRPRKDKRLLPVDGAQIAENCDLVSGAIEPFNGLKSIETFATPAGTIKSIYPYNGSWLRWTTDVNVVKSPLADDQFSRIYFTGDGAPKVRGIISGVERQYDLGVQKPSAPPTIGVQKISIPWVPTWGYFYEEPDGSQSDLNLYTLIVDTVDGQRFVVDNFTAPDGSPDIGVPPKVGASASSVLMIFFDAYSESGTLLGRVYCEGSKYTSNNDFYLGGYHVNMSIQRPADPQSQSAPHTLDILYVTPDGTVNLDTRSWLYTFVSVFGEEGPPSDASDVITMDPSKRVRIQIPDRGTQSSVYAPIEKIRIYRTVTSNDATLYQFIREIDANTSEKIYDTVLDVEAGETVSSVGWRVPNADLIGLVSMPGAFLAGFTGNTVWFSEPDHPHAWPVNYGIGLDYDIVGMAASGNMLMVLTKGTPYIITASDPGSANVVKVASNQPCVAKRGIVEASGAVAYPSPDGIVVCSGATAIVYSEIVFSKADWMALNPDTMFSAVYDNKVYFFSDNETLIFPVTQQDPVVVTSTIRPTAAHYDVEDDALYVVVGSTLYQWDADTTKLALRWRSKEVVSPRPYAPAVARVIASAYPVTLAIQANNAEVLAAVATDDVAFRLPVLRKEKFWEFEVRGTAGVNEVLVGESMGDL